MFHLTLTSVADVKMGLFIFSVLVEPKTFNSTDDGFDRIINFKKNTLRNFEEFLSIKNIETLKTLKLSNADSGTLVMSWLSK